MRRALPIAIAVFLAGLGSYALTRLDRPTPPPTTRAVPARDEPPPPPTLVEHSPRTGRPTDRLLALDGDIAFYRHRAETTPHAWLDWDRVATSYMDRARLSGDYADWQRAEAALESAFSAGEGVGPYLSRASFNLTMHRIDRVDADLDAMGRSGVITLSDSDAVLSMRAEARYYAGRYAEARELYEGNVARSRRGVDPLVMLAQLDWHTGHFDDATALMDEALAHPILTSTQAAPTRAWVLLTRAMLERDRGRYADALARIDEARAQTTEPDAHLEELAAEIHELNGDDDEALRAFRAISSTTSSPQSIDGVARILRRQGDTVAAAELVGVARAAYDGQMAMFPEAAWGHAIDHWLRLEPEDVDRMITIAEGNAHARPYGETRVKLAMAYLLAGRTADARREIDAVLATEWSTADLHAVNAIVILREGRDASAEDAVADAIAPGILRRLAWIAP
jgi:tetratricopeptide (TPR) repeat protein